MYRTTALALLVATILGGLVACGDDEPGPAAQTSAKPSVDAMDGMSMSGGGSGEMAGMTKLASSERSDLDVALLAMAPERFYISEGDGLREQKPTAEDKAHLMVTLADHESGVRLPDATVTARVTDPEGRTEFEGPLYPMVGRGMGLHYGENVPLGKPGEYTVTLTVGPPRIGRHRAVAKAWSGTEKITQKVNFDGKTLRAG